MAMNALQYIQATVEPKNPKQAELHRVDTLVAALKREPGLKTWHKKGGVHSARGTGHDVLESIVVWPEHNTGKSVSVKVVSSAGPGCWINLTVWAFDELVSGVPKQTVALKHEEIHSNKISNTEILDWVRKALKPVVTATVEPTGRTPQEKFVTELSGLVKFRMLGSKDTAFGVLKRNAGIAVNVGRVSGGLSAHPGVGPDHVQVVIKTEGNFTQGSFWATIGTWQQCAQQTKGQLTGLLDFLEAQRGKSFGDFKIAFRAYAARHAWESAKANLHPVWEALNTVTATVEPGRDNLLRKSDAHAWLHRLIAQTAAQHLDASIHVFPKTRVEYADFGSHAIALQPATNPQPYLLYYVYEKRRGKWVSTLQGNLADSYEEFARKVNAELHRVLATVEPGGYLESVEHVVFPTPGARKPLGKFKYDFLITKSGNRHVRVFSRYPADPKVELWFYTKGEPGFARILIDGRGSQDTTFNLKDLRLPASTRNPEALIRACVKHNYPNVELG